MHAATACIASGRPAAGGRPLGAGGRPALQASTSYPPAASCGRGRRLAATAAAAAGGNVSRWRDTAAAPAACAALLGKGAQPKLALGARRPRRWQRAGPLHPAPRRAADLTRGVAAEEEEASSSGAVVASSAASTSAAFTLFSPHDAEIFALAVPALFSILLDPIMGLVDTAIVGRLGTAPLAGVGVGTILMNFSSFLWNFLLYTTVPRIAAAAAKKDLTAVSKITAQGLWVATAIGCVTTTVLWFGCPAMFAAMGVAPSVAAQAVPYLRGRCVASPAVLAFFVLAGTFRGFKDTRTPLMAGLISNVVHVGLDVVLVFALGWGVVGAALATSLSHWLTLLILMGLVMQRGYLRSVDLRTRPRWAEVAPTMRNGLLLSTRSLLSMSMIMWATKLIAGFGAVGLAAHEILRQIWVVSNQLFTSLDIATQSLFAFYIGRNERRTAVGVFRRALALAVVAGVAVCGLLVARSTAFPAMFSRDPAVVAAAATALPLIAAFLPLDAAASVMDGVLLASQKAGWMSKIMIVAASICTAGLVLCQRMGWPLLAVWAAVKCLTVGRLLGNAYMLARHPASPLVHHAAPQAA